MFQTSVGDLGVREIEFFEVFEGFQARQSGVGDFDGYETEGFEAFQARQVFEACVRDRGASEGQRFELAETLEVFQIGVGELVGQNPQIFKLVQWFEEFALGANVLTARQVDGDHVLKEILPEPASRPRRRVEFGVEFFGTDVVIAPDLTKGSEAAFVNKNIGLMALVIVDDSPAAPDAATVARCRSACCIWAASQAQGTATTTVSTKRKQRLNWNRRRRSTAAANQKAMSDSAEATTAPAISTVQPL